jgi:RNA polymerase-binding transcription factor DksA
MATKKTVTKKVTKPVAKPIAKPAVKKAVPVKATTKKVVKPIAKPAVKKAVPVKATSKKVVKPIAKPAAKKAVPVKKVAPVKKSQPAKKTAPVKATTKKVVKPVVKAGKPAVKKVAPSKPITKKIVAKPVKKVESKPKAKEILKPKAKEVAKPVNKKVTPIKPVVVSSEAPIQKSMKKSEGKLKKKQEVIAKMPTKQAKPTPKKSASKLFAKPSGVEKSTTIIPMKQLPMRKKEEPIKEVKIPKTSIKTSIPYNPVYTPLEKRVEVSKPSEPLIKYSDSELNEFRDLINKKIDAAKKELSFLQGSITRKDDMGGDGEDGRYMTMEDGSLSMEREQLSQMASRQITYIDHLEKALMRIENKTYGICRVTGKLIDKARLRAVPHATLSLEAKLGLVKAPSAD